MTKHIKVDYIIKPGGGATYRWYRSMDRGQRPDDGVRSAEDLSSGEVQAACVEHPEWTTKSAKIKRHLAFIGTFAPR